MLHTAGLVKRFGSMTAVDRVGIQIPNGPWTLHTDLPTDLKIDLRASSVLGFVGAGGIGLQLSDRIRVNNWDEVGFLLIMILLTVSLIDRLSKSIRSRFI